MIVRVAADRRRPVKNRPPKNRPPKNRHVQNRAGPQRSGAAGRRPAWLLLALLAACQPRVAVEAPKEPITINLNIRLDADVRLRIEEQAEEDVETKPIF